MKQALTAKKPIFFLEGLKKALEKNINPELLIKYLLQ